MRKVIILISAVILLAALSGCQVLLPSFVDTNGSAQETVKRANASNIATAYNAYVALYPDKNIGMEKSDFKDPEELHTEIGDDLWPKGMSTEAAEAAWPWLTITEGHADVKPAGR